MKKFPPQISILLTIDANTLGKYTSLLQGGIFLTTDQGTPIGELLISLPDFSHEYASKRIQTIFVDGLPADDLDQPLFGMERVIAISAAMPGLAGAIFRKNGLHASLRTSKERSHTDSSTPDTPVRIRLKLFNMIAEEKGEAILRKGCILIARNLEKYLTYRQPLLAHIKQISQNGETISLKELLSLLEKEDFIQLTLQEHS